MREKIHLGLVLQSMPSASETFVSNKIEGLSKNPQVKLKLFISNSNPINDSRFKNVKIYNQIDVKKLFLVFYKLIKIILMRPIKISRFISLELKSGRTFFRLLKNIIINYNFFLSKNLDWIHFCFSNVGINRENIAEVLNAKMSCSLRGQDISLFPYNSNESYELLFKKIDKIHTISYSLYEQAIRLGLSKKINFEKITPAIDIDFFKPSINKNELSDPIRILTVGRLTIQKGYDFMFDALKILKNRGLNFEYRVIGEGNYYEALSYATHYLGLKNYIKFLGKKNQKEILNQMDWADIYVQPSIQEGFCNSVVEAQAMGLLIVVSDAQGLIENIVDGETGWVVSKRNASAIANKIIEISKLDSNEIRLYQSKARRRAALNFSLNDQNEKFRKFFRG